MNSPYEITSFTLEHLHNYVQRAFNDIIFVICMNKTSRIPSSELASDIPYMVSHKDMKQIWIDMNSAVLTMWWTLNNIHSE
jgi:hypothetical protein